MSHLRTAIGAFQSYLTSLPRTWPLPEILETRRAADRLGALEAATAPPNGSMLEHTRRRLLTARERGESFHLRDLRDAPWLLWNGSPRLADYPDILDAVTDTAGRSGPTLRALIEAWLRYFAAESSAIIDGGRLIQRLISIDRHPRNDSWRRASGRFDFFDAANGPRRVAAWLIGETATIAATLGEIGFDDPFRGSGGYTRAIQAEFLEILSLRLVEPDAIIALDRAEQFLMDGPKLRFEDQQAIMAQFLLKPWLVGARKPAAPIRERVQTLLLQHLGDPRMRRARWQDVGEREVALIRQWVTKASLRAFFNLISEFALDQHWKFRQAFWGACLDACERQNIAFDAWLALGPDILKSARSVKELAQAYGRLSGSGVKSNHAVLVLRVGDLILAEWSHVGPLRAWPANSPAAPKMEKMLYHIEDFRIDGLRFPPNPLYGSNGTSDGNGLAHRGSENSRWQGSAALLLERYAGVRLTLSDWRPR